MYLGPLRYLWGCTFVFNRNGGFFGEMCFFLGGFSFEVLGGFFCQLLSFLCDGSAHGVHVFSCSNYSRWSHCCLYML